jgi:hypothetical protein
MDEQSCEVQPGVVTASWPETVLTCQASRGGTWMVLSLASTCQCPQTLLFFSLPFNFFFFFLIFSLPNATILQ